MHLVDSHYCADPAKFISVLCTSLSTMLQVELPHVNVLSKMDLIEQYDKLGKELECQQCLISQESVNTFYQKVFQNVLYTILVLYLYTILPKVSKHLTSTLISVFLKPLTQSRKNTEV